MHPTLAGGRQQKSSLNKTKLNRCTKTEIRWNKNEDIRTYPVVSTNLLPNSLNNWKSTYPVKLAVELTIFWHLVDMFLREFKNKDT